MKKILLAMFILTLLILPITALAANLPPACLQNPNSQACKDAQNPASSGSTNLSTNPIVEDINTVVTFLSAGVGIVVTAMIIVGGIQYMMAGDNPQAVSAAKGRITHALIALLAFALM